ncbi:MAG: S41 family peptidase [Phycisphaerae bacterium]
MDHRLPRAAKARFGLVCILLLAPCAAVAAPASNNDQLWREGLALVGRGQFDEAYQTIDRLIESGRSDERAKQVHEWLGSFEKLQAQRREMSEADYEKYVGWVKDRCEKKQWTRAVDDLFRAFLSCSDPAAFRKESWVQDVVSHAVRHAAELREKGQWLEAIRIYGALVEIFEPDGQEYRRLRQQCRTHILLEETYKPSGEWRETVRGIEPDMARNALRLVGERYVTEPDFNKVALGGLERLSWFAATTKLGETFPSMKDRDLVDNFARRINERIRQTQERPNTTLAETLGLFDRALEINKETLRIPQEVIIAEFMEGALEPLDEFSSMIWPSEVDQFRKDTMGEFSGVGIQISLENGLLKVISPLEDTPAYAAGIQPGDIITKVNGEKTDGITIDQAVRRITGPAGTKVTLTIRRVGQEKEFDVPVVRERIVIHTVKGVSREPDGRWNCWADPDRKIAYVRVTGFMENTVDELAETLGRLRREQMRGLILDLRFNPGGLLKSAVDMCDLFLPPEKRIVSTKGRDSKEWELSSSRRDNFANMPLIVLVNDFSASASEIVSGALQDHHRCLIVGERTFGKGLVQNLEALVPTGTAYIKLTTAKYYLPNGRCIQKEPGLPDWGVDPNVRIKLVPKETRKVLELRRKQEVLKGKDQKELPTTTEPDDELETDKSPTTTRAADDDEPKDENNRPDIDPQYEAALLLMRVRVLTNQPWPFETEPVTARAATR